MENNYFTPSIEDIRVGYECEICPNLGYENVWIPTVGRCEQNSAKDCNLDELTYDCLIDGHIGIRVPYLTKEQIEAEGWKTISDSQFQKDSVWFSFQSDLKKVMFWEPAGEILFHGECKDINTFRYICKLLGI